MAYSNKKIITVLVASVAVLALFILTIYSVNGTPARRYPEEPIAEYYKDYQLKMVHVVFRHGQRTPADTYPNDPYINETLYPYGWGQLTNKGKKSLYEIGTWLRKRYNGFLDNTYSPSILYAQSTDVDRTKMSLELVLASLFPPKGTDLEWNKELNWQPIPFNFENLAEDTLLLVRKSCPRYHEEFDRVLKSDDFKKLMETNKELYQNLTEITGLKVKDPEDIQSLYSTLKTEKDYGLKLPKWTDEYFPDKLKHLTVVSYILNVYNDELKKLKGGPFLKKTLGEWEFMAQNEHDRANKKIYLYAGHDSSVANIMSTFNVWKEQIPDYGIMAVFELYKNFLTAEFSISIMLKRVDEEPEQLKIPGCERLCPLSKVRSLLRNLIPTNMTEECAANDINFTEPPARGP